jgi:hypothetical protein
MNKFSMIVLLISAIVSAIIMASYYYSVFKEEKIKMYDSFSYSLFILHLVVLYIIVTIFNYLFIKLILGSPIYGIKKPITINYSTRSRPFGLNSIFNENTRNLFRRNNTKPVNFNSLRPNYIVGDPNIGIPYTEFE